jgi:hypothetical protein
MKRSLLCSTALAFGLMAWTALAQSPPAQPNQQPNQPAANQQNQPAQPQPAQPNQQAQPQQAQPAPNQPAQPNINVNTQPAPGANVQVQPGAQAQPGAVAVGAQPNAAQPTGTMVNGRIVRTGQDQFIVQGVDNKSYTFYTNPQTRFWMNNNPVQFSNLQVGSNVTAWYSPQGERFFVNRVNVLPAGATFPVQEATPAVQAAPTGTSNTTFYEGEIVRVVGQDQVVLRTPQQKEIIVYVQPQTTYRIEDRPATFTDLRPGAQIRVDYEMRDRRPYARGILGVRRDRR